MKPTAGRLLVLLTLASAACGDGTGPEDIQYPSGSITFDYLGPRDGSFSAIGGIRLRGNGDPIAADWAAGTVAEDVEDAFAAIGFDHATGERGDFFVLAFEGLLGPGPFEIGGGCTASCPLMMFALDTTLDDVDTDVAWLCTVDFGAAVVTELSATRLAGTFGGGGACLSDTSFQVFVITNGVFDVPIIEDYSTGF